jgi:hypothetical protein
VPLAEHRERIELDGVLSIEPDFAQKDRWAECDKFIGWIWFQCVTFADGTDQNFFMLLGKDWIHRTLDHPQCGSSLVSAVDDRSQGSALNVKLWHVGFLRE